jgi:hypothetical protein
MLAGPSAAPLTLWLIILLNADTGKSVDNRVRVSRYCNSAAGYCRSRSAERAEALLLDILGIHSVTTTWTLDWKLCVHVEDS